MRSWRTRPGEQIRGLPRDSVVMGQGTYEGRPQWVYQSPSRRSWYRITMMLDRSYTVEEYSQAEIDQTPCVGETSDCDD